MELFSGDSPNTRNKTVVSFTSLMYCIQIELYNVYDACNVHIKPINRPEIKNYGKLSQNIFRQKVPLST